MWFPLSLLALYSSAAATAFTITQSPLSRRVAWVQGIEDLAALTPSQQGELRELFQKCPLLIFQSPTGDVREGFGPSDLLRFLRIFDPDSDCEALEDPTAHPGQILHSFDRLENFEHIAPRGNVVLNNYFGINKIVKPTEPFIENYIWHCDIYGHSHHLPNVVTGFYMLATPSVGGETDFVSGEDVYESLTADERTALANMVATINRAKFSRSATQKNYAGRRDGAVRTEPFTKELQEHDIDVPMLVAPDGSDDGVPRVILQPSFFERINGWSVERSRDWLEKFMTEKILPRRVSVQWRPGDIGVFNNRRFIHSSTPSVVYSSKPGTPLWEEEPSKAKGTQRLLHQVFLPTSMPVRTVAPTGDAAAAVRCGWASPAEAKAAAAAAEAYAAAADRSTRQRLQAAGVSVEDRAGTFLQSAKLMEEAVASEM